AEPGQVAGRLRLGGDARARRLEDQAEGLAKRLTIAREAAAARELERPLERALEEHVEPHALDAHRGGRHLGEGAGELRDHLLHLEPAGIVGPEPVLGGRGREAFDEDLHGVAPWGGGSSGVADAPARAKRAAGAGPAAGPPGRWAPPGARRDATLHCPAMPQ